MRCLNFIAVKGWVFILCIVITTNAFSQNYPLRHYTVDDGLNNNTVYDAIQDDNGFMWFATVAGVSQFDGKVFESFTIDDGLGDNEILSIKKDFAGRLWLLAFNGTITVIDNYTIYNGLEDSLLKKLGPGFYYNNIYFDSENIAWISNMRNVFSKIDFPKSFSQTPIDTMLVFSTPKGKIISAKKSGLVYMPQLEWPNKIDLPAKTKRWCYYRDSMFVVLTDSFFVTIGKNHDCRKYDVDAALVKNALDIYCDNDFGIWITTQNKGVLYFEKTSSGYKFYDRFLKDEYVTSAFRDNESNVWFTTHGNGVFMMPYNFKNVKSYTVQSGMLENEVYSVAVDSKNRIWAGHKFGRVDIMDGDSVAHLYLDKDPLNIGRVLKIEEHSFGKMIISGDVGFFIYDLGTNTNKIDQAQFVSQNGTEINRSPAVKNFSIEENGDIIITSTESIYKLESKYFIKDIKPLIPMALPLKRYYAAETDREGNLWVSDFDGLVQIKNGERVLFNKKNQLFAKRITSINRMGDKIIVSIVGYGLAIIEDEKLVRHITVSDGLLSNHCGNLFVVDSSVFVCTNLGLNVLRFNGNNISVEQVTTASGLLSNQVNDVFVKENKIYAATLNGISEIKILENNNVKKEKPGVYFSRIILNGKNIVAEINPQIKYSDRHIRFDFVSPNFSYPQGVRYQYNLNDGQWIETQNRSLEFNSLTSQQYKLQIRASHLQSEWSEPLSYSFTILSPIYKTWWFYSIIGTVLLTVGGVIYFARINSLKREQTVKLAYEQQINRLQNQSLQAMMNPHFIFNSLNAINIQINSGNSLSASNYLSRFAKLLRLNMQTIKEEMIPLNEELERINLYLQIEKIRLGEKLNYSVVISPEVAINDIQIPSMIIQPFLENSIWHGIMPLDKNGNLKLTIDSEEKKLVIKIDDDGIGINRSKKQKKDAAGTTHYGIPITKERLNILQKKYNQNVSLTIVDKSEMHMQGTLVTIVMPSIIYS